MNRRDDLQFDGAEDAVQRLERVARAGAMRTPPPVAVARIRAAARERMQPAAAKPVWRTYLALAASLLVVAVLSWHGLRPRAGTAVPSLSWDPLDAEIEALSVEIDALAQGARTAGAAARSAPRSWFERCDAIGAEIDGLLKQWET